MRFLSFSWRRPLALIAVVLAAGALLQFTDTNPAVSQALTLKAYEAPEDPGLDPASDVWKGNVSSVRVPLTAQAGIYAAGGGSIPTVRVQAVHYQERLYIRAEWADGTLDEATTRVEDFSDAVALEFPAKSASSVPSICMGQADAGVNIWHWRADSQAGLKDPVAIYAGAVSDEPESKDNLFYTAREAGNPFANPDLGAVQNLVSETFGALTIASVQDVTGEGKHDGENWAVVFVRDYAGAGADQANFAAGAKTDMALAVWNGSEDDRNGRKSLSQFVTLSISDSVIPGGGGGTNMTAAWFGIALVLGLAALGVGLGVVGLRETGNAR
ncbi:MAG: hypothetical protein IT303_11935 [Dehalococcoidia bacterium]|nr:hypothetical protein [Dehalococcoidia bacterium]